MNRLPLQIDLFFFQDRFYSPRIVGHGQRGRCHIGKYEQNYILYMYNIICFILFDVLSIFSENGNHISIWWLMHLFIFKLTCFSYIGSIIIVITTNKTYAALWYFYYFAISCMTCMFVRKYKGLLYIFIYRAWYYKSKYTIQHIRT